VRPVLRKYGYDICWAHERRDPFDDMKRLSVESPVIFDVGAHFGETIIRFYKAFDRPTVHAFEPSKESHNILKRECETFPNLIENNLALGATRGTMRLLENENTYMTSFLELGRDGNGQIVNCTAVGVDTIDDYCKERGIDRIDILKSDAQGFDLEVLKGAQRMMKRGAINLVYLEINFAEIYKNSPAPDEILAFMRQRGFSLVTFYRLFYVNGRLGWTDALFKRD
jgi:FkbM family methyltransferase